MKRCSPLHCRACARCLALRRLQHESSAKAIAKSQELLNVSYDPTRELWKALNKEFIADYKKQDRRASSRIKQSHGGSSSQARNVIDGLEADVVTLAMWSDTNAIAKAGLIKEGWQERLPNGALPYSSTIVFVVRKGNPKQIKDWPDLVRDGVEVITPSAKTSGNGKLSFLAAWGSVVLRDGSEKDAIEFVTQAVSARAGARLGARAATTTFAQKKIGDVHLTWENEAFFEVKEAGGELEIVYPPISIRAEPRVAVVDANVDRKKTRDAAEAYLEVPLHARGARDHRPELTIAPRSRRSCASIRSRSVGRAVHDSADRGQLGRSRRAVLRRRRRVRPDLQSGPRISGSLAGAHWPCRSRIATFCPVFR